MLTPDHVKQLTAPFQYDDHEFLGKFTYLTEESVSARLDAVDPNWRFEIISIYPSNDQAVVHARMTVCDVPRDGVGMAALTVTIKGTGEIKPAHADPEKSAATDALRRCARLFGIGRYLLGAPKEVSLNELQAWLHKTIATLSLTDDLRDRPTAEAFFTRWRKEGLSDAEIVMILGVKKVSEWAQGKAKADKAVDAWLLVNTPASKKKAS